MCDDLVPGSGGPCARCESCGPQNGTEGLGTTGRTSPSPCPTPSDAEEVATSP
ncbi:hypothetical protein N9L76_10420 [bacterium]|nr:hypothetical protein [bacterium]